ncbi:MAG: ABC transporter transmembrane domain-containing protein, partial [Geminicoccaceae bacterium]
MHQDAIFSSASLSQWSSHFARWMRLDEPPVIEPLPEGYKTTGALPFLFDIVRSMLVGRALLVLAAAIISQILFSLQPYGLSRLIDSLSASVASPDAIDDVAIWVAVLFAFWIGGPFFFQLAKLGNVYLIPHLRVAIKARLFQHLMGHTPHFFHENLPGRIAQKLTQAATSGHSLMIMLTIELVQTIVLTITACLLIGTLSAHYGMVLGIWIVLFLGTTAYAGRYGVYWSKGVQNAISRVSGRLVDTINNWDLVRGFSRLDHERDGLATTLEGEASWGRRARLFFVGMGILHMFLGVVLMAWLVTSAIADTRAG